MSWICSDMEMRTNTSAPNSPLPLVGRAIACGQRTSSALRAASPEEKRLDCRYPSISGIWGGPTASRFSFGEAARRADEVPFPLHAIALPTRGRKKMTDHNFPRTAVLLRGNDGNLGCNSNKPGTDLIRRHQAFAFNAGFGQIAALGFVE